MIFLAWTSFVGVEPKKKQNINKLKILQNSCLRNLFYNIYKIGRIGTMQNIKDIEHLVDLELKLNFHKIITKELKANINRYKDSKQR